MKLPATIASARATVLMYHAVADVPEGADAHYAVSRGQFLRHLGLVHACGSKPCSVQRLRGDAPADGLPGPAFTFDDGHASNAWAAEAMAELGGAGDFFVNPSTVGTPNHLSWAQLREMAKAGMSIQSHGQNHRYLDELSEADVMAELVESKQQIEDKLGQPVDIFAPPGGRMGRNFFACARRAGYTTVCSSRVGLWRLGSAQPDVPRLAVLHATGDAQFRRWLTQDTAELLRVQARHRLLAAGKRMLGNQRYERLRQGLLGSSS